MDSSAETKTSRTLVGPAVMALLAAGVLFVLGRNLGSVVVVALSVHWFLLFAVLVGVRSQVLRSDSSSSLAVRRSFVALLFLAIALTGIAFSEDRSFIGSSSDGSLLGIGALLTVAAGGSGAMALAFRAPSAVAIKDASGLRKLCRIGAWLALLGALSVFAAAAGWFDLRSGVAKVLCVVPLLLAGELLLWGVFSFFRRPPASAPFGAGLFLTRVLGSSLNPIQSVFSGIEETFGVDVRSSWALGFLRRVAFSLIVGLAAFAWGMSSFVVVDESQLAVRERFGKVKTGEVLQPGLNVGLPWPFDRVRVVDTQRVRSMPLGFSGAKTEVNSLWTQYHAAEEYNLLIGDGRDLVTVNVELQYRVSDIHDWIYGCQNPEEALQTLAYRVLMQSTVDRTLDEVLSQDIGNFSGDMMKALQEQVDAKGLGVELVSLDLRGLHPPVALATEYQSVISAQLDRKTYVIDAEAFRESTLPKAKSDAEAAVRTASAESLERLAEANGEAIAFQTLEAQYDVNPSLYRFRRRLETLEEVLPEKAYHLLDSRIERDGGAVWFLQ